MQAGLRVRVCTDFARKLVWQLVFGASGARSAVLAGGEVEQHHCSMGDRFLHPWLKQSRRIAPGSYALLFGLITVLSSKCLSPFSGSHGPIRVSPLVSQPLLEIALRIPTYLHCRFSQDRAVARAAFAA